MPVHPSGYVPRVASVVRRLRADARAQDLVEYALLTAVVGFCCVAAWGLIENAIGTRYTTLDTQTQNLWEPDDPASAAP